MLHIIINLILSARNYLPGEATRRGTTMKMTLNTYNYQYISNTPFDSSFEYKTNWNQARPLVMRGYITITLLIKKHAGIAGSTDTLHIKETKVLSTVRIISIYLPLTSYNNLNQG